MVYSCQEESVWAPIVKEYEIRTGMTVSVYQGSFQDLETRILRDTLSREFDLVFGADAATLDRYEDHWLEADPSLGSALDPAFVLPDRIWIPFCSLPAVILYNTRIVTWREVPDGWDSLLEPRWKGRIAFVDPEYSAACAAAFVSAVTSVPASGNYMSALMENLDGRIMDTPGEALDAVAEGRCSIGIAFETDAQRLKENHSDIDYIYPAEGFILVPYGSAVIKDCARPQAAAEFLSFSVSQDAQRVLSTALNRRPVRRDVSLSPGLSALSQLPRRDSGPDFYDERSMLLAQWRQLLSERKGGAGL
ncbi:MAG: extracellular solute-binding protein [Eubacteriales bacterium]|nr:extracellular solute-binding protein [Eubacteriales bacterium]